MIYRILKRLFIYLIFVVSALFASNDNIKSEEKFYVIDSSFDETKLMFDLKEFTGYKNKLSKKRTEWIYKLTAIASSYKQHFKTVSVIKRKYKYEAIFTAKKGEIFYFADGKMLPPEDLTHDKNHRSYIYQYPLGKKPAAKPKKMKFPDPIDFAFLNSLYGVYPIEREYNLEIFTALNRRLRFHSMQNASHYLKNALKEIESAAKKDKEILYWVNNIQVIYTFIVRNLENTNIQSLHGYGIAFDVLPYNRSKHIYWQWAEEFKKDWWNIDEKDKVAVPDKVIEIFENQGFIWGGKWYFFDIMHFEYRPELIKYNQLLRDDPLNKNIETAEKE